MPKLYTLCVFFFSQDTQNSAIIKCTRIVPIAICIGCTREGLKRFAHRMSQRLLIKTTKILLQIGTCNNICTFTVSHAYEATRTLYYAPKITEYVSSCIMQLYNDKTGTSIIYHHLEEFKVRKIFNSSGV